MKNKFIKIIVLVSALLLLFLLSFCNQKKEENNDSNDSSSIQENNTQEEIEITLDDVIEEVTIEDETVVVKEDTDEKNDVSNLYYWVNFLNKDGSVISREAYKYGTTPKVPSNPTYTDGFANYEFTGWDKTISVVHMTQTYNAQYAITSYIYQKPSSPVVTADEALVTGAHYKLIFQSYGSDYSFVYKKTSTGFELESADINGEDQKDFLSSFCKSKVDGSKIIFDYGYSDYGSLIKFSLDTSDSTYTVTGTIADSPTITSFLVKPVDATDFTEIEITSH